MKTSQESVPADERNGIALMALSVVLFSANVLLLRALSARWPVADGIMASLYRGAVGILFVAALYWGRGLEVRRLATQPWVVLRGAVGAVGILCFYVTIAKLGAGRATILNLTYPAFGAIMAAIWLGERLTLLQCGWMALAFGGLCAFFAESITGGGFSGYDFVGVLGAIVAGAAVVIIRLLRHREHPSTVYGSQCVWSLVASLPFCAGNVVKVPLVPVIGLAIAAVLVAMAQIAMTRAFHSLSVARGSSMQMAAPVFVAGAGVLLFGEHFSLLEIIGGAVSLGATWMAVRPPASRSPGAPPPPGADSSPKSSGNPGSAALRVVTGVPTR